MNKRSLIGISNIAKNHWHPCCQESPEQPLDAPYYPVIEEDGSGAMDYRCPRGHTFQSKNPLVIAVESNPDYNSGPICSYCLVDWHRNNVNAEIAS